jgi:hypothetical protein
MRIRNTGKSNGKELEDVMEVGGWCQLKMLQMQAGRGGGGAGDALISYGISAEQ